MIVTDEQSKTAKTTKATKAKATDTGAAVEAPLNKEMRKIRIKELTHEGVKYGVDVDTNDVYDYENLRIGNRVLVGKFVELAPGKFKIV